jgi:hypothetical protein
MSTCIDDVAGGVALAGSPGFPFGENVTVTPEGSAVFVRVMNPDPPVMVTVQITSVPTPAVWGRQTETDSGTKKFAIALTGPLMFIVLVDTPQLGLQAKPDQAWKADEPIGVATSVMGVPTVNQASRGLPLAVTVPDPTGFTDMVR